jgi:hypothetical protein
MAFMDTPDFRTHKKGWTLFAGFDAGLQSDSVSLGCVQGYPASLRANGSRERAPDDRLREAIHLAAQRKNGLLRRFAMTGI